jgi:hypothetical protein
MQNDIIEKIIDINKGRLGKLKKTDSKVLLEGRNHLVKAVGVSMVGRFIAENSFCSPIVVSSNLPGAFVGLFKSFGCAGYEQTGGKIAQMLLKHPFLSLKSFIIVLLAVIKLRFRTDSDFTKSLTLRTCGITYGDLVYDTYICSNLRFTNLHKDKFVYYKMLFRCILEIGIANRLFKKYSIKKVVVTTWNYMYIGSYLARLASNKGVPVVLVSGNFVREFNGPEAPFTYSNIVTVSNSYLLKYRNNIESEIERYLSEYFSGKADINSKNAFNNKQTLTRAGFLREMKVGNEHQKIIFIMPHCFSDAAHGGGSMLFRDYYDWLIKTLEHIKHIKGVLWVVRPHPGAYMYNEARIVEELVQSINQNNVRLCPADLSTKTVLQVADVIVTVRGTIAIEAAIFGIPVVTCGKLPCPLDEPVIAAKTQKHYFEILDNIKDLPRPSPEKNNEYIMKMLYLYHFDYRIINSKILFRTAIPPGSRDCDKKRMRLETDKILYNNILNNDYETDAFYSELAKLISK